MKVVVSRQQRALKTALLKYLRVLGQSCPFKNFLPWFLSEARTFYGRNEAPEAAAAWRRKYRPRPRRCFVNGQRLALALPHVVSYVEGWALADIPLAHGWNVTTDGRCVDLTWEAVERRFPNANLSGAVYMGVEVPTWFLCYQAVDTACWQERLFTWYVHLECGGSREHL